MNDPSPDESLENPSWWSGECGGREVLRIALPLIVATMSWTLMHFIDRMFLLWHSDGAMGAAMSAGMLHFMMICFPLGVVSYANTFVAQYVGNGQPGRVGPAVWQAAWLGIAATPLFLLAIPAAPAIFRFFGHEGNLFELETVYFQILAWGAGGAVVSAALATFYTGRGVTRVVMVVEMASAAANVALDYFWIFGHAGFPAMGIEGAGWATVVAIWIKVPIYFVLMGLRRNVAAFGTHNWRIDVPLLRRLCRFGVPSGIHMLADMTAITLFILLIGELGEEAMAVTTLAFNVNSVAFMPIVGMGIAVATLVGQHLGQDRPGMAARAAWNAFRLGAIYSGAMALFYVLAPDLFLLGHRLGVDAAKFETLRNETVLLLRFVAAYCVFDAMAITFASALKGAGDMRFILIATLATAFPFLFVGWAGMHWYGLGLYWSWTVITIWVCTLGVVYLARFLQGRWRTMRVIEPLVELPSDMDAKDAEVAAVELGA